jgi:hypothetical protein
VSHQLETCGIRFFFNGDFSGDVTIVTPAAPGTPPHEAPTFDVPFTALKELVAEAVRRKKISDLEDLEADELLGFD